MSALPDFLSTTIVYGAGSGVHEARVRVRYPVWEYAGPDDPDAYSVPLMPDELRKFAAELLATADEMDKLNRQLWDKP